MFTGTRLPFHIGLHFFRDVCSALLYIFVLNNQIFYASQDNKVLHRLQCKVCAYFFLTSSLLQSMFRRTPPVTVSLMINYISLVQFHHLN